MELDQLRDQWNKVSATEKTSAVSLRNIIRNRNRNPFDALQRGFRQRIILLMLVLLLLVRQFSADTLMMSPFFWCYMVLWLSVVVFHVINYRFVKTWGQMDSSVHEFLVNKVAVLRKRIALMKVYTKVLLLVLVLVVEFLPYHGEGHMIDKWRALHPAARIGIYATFFVLQHFASRWIAQRKFGRHLDRMEELLKQAE
jgi:hypothetical protein